MNAKDKHGTIALPQPTCRLCGRVGVVLYDQLRDRLCGSPGTWTLKRCPGKDCGLAWLDPQPGPADLQAAYRDYFTHKAEPDAPSPAQQLYRRLLQLTPIGRERHRLEWMYLDQTTPGRLLEIGCGNGQRLARFREAGWDVTGQEVDPTAAALAREKFGLKVHLEALEKLTGSYDMIVMNHVIEHVPDPAVVLRECHRLMRSGGGLVLTTPNIASYGHRRFGADWRGLDPPRHLHLFSKTTLRTLAERAGFLSPTITTTSARVVGTALASQRTGPFCTMRAVCFQVWAASRQPFAPDDGDECVLQASK